MSDPPLCRPSLCCRIFGHKWFTRIKIKQYRDALGDIHTDKKWTERRHCDRCGVPNPNWME